MILRAVEGGEIDAVPPGQLGDIVETGAAFDARRQFLSGLLVTQPCHHRLHAAGEIIRRQNVQQLGGTGGVGVYVAVHRKALASCLLQKRQHLRDLAAPVIPAHGLQVADVDGTVQRPGHCNHLLYGGHHAAALLPHVDSDRDLCPGHRLQGADEVGCGVEALRGVAQTKADAQRTVGQCLLHGTVDGGKVTVRQLRQLIACRVGPESTCPHQHPRIYRKRRQRAKVARQ